MRRIQCADLIGCYHLGSPSAGELPTPRGKTYNADADEARCARACRTWRHGRAPAPRPAAHVRREGADRARV